MPVRQYKPTTAGRRYGSAADFSNLTKKRPEKKLARRVAKTGGRNSHGRITCRHRGGGHKRLYRQIDFKRDKDGVPAKVTAVEYDPNRSARIALLCYADGEKRYILCPDRVEVGQTLVSGEGIPPRPGNSLPLAGIPTGMTVHSVEMQPGRGGQVARSAGQSATLMAIEGKWALITMPSGEFRRVSAKCRATVGTVGNADHMNVLLGKAGRKRWLGRRPHVRGTAMNPVAHPMGGGEGRSAGGRHPCSPTGKLSKGGKTRKKRSPTSKHIIRRRTRRRRR